MTGFREDPRRAVAEFISCLALSCANCLVPDNAKPEWNVSLWFTSASPAKESSAAPAGMWKWAGGDEECVKGKLCEKLSGVSLSDKTRAIGCDPIACSNEVVCPGWQVKECSCNLLNQLELLKYLGRSYGSLHFVEAFCDIWSCICYTCRGSSLWVLSQVGSMETQKFKYPAAVGFNKTISVVFKGRIRNMWILTKILNA